MKTRDVNSVLLCTPPTVLVVHGLNLCPDKMQAIVKMIEDQGFKVVQVTLAGHAPADSISTLVHVSASQWKIQLIEALVQNGPVHGVVAYSLGGLCYLSALAQIAQSSGQSENKFQSFSFPRFQILLAPAIGLRSYTQLIRIFAHFKKLVIPSLSHPQYRRHAGLPIAAYNALFELVDELSEAARRGFKLSGVTSLAMSSKDELVDFKKTEKLLGLLTNNSHKTLMFRNANSVLRPSYNHLILDLDSLGAAEFANLERFIKTRMPI